MPFCRKGTIMIDLFLPSNPTIHSTSTTPINPPPCPLSSYHHFSAPLCPLPSHITPKFIMAGAVANSMVSKTVQEEDLGEFQMREGGDSLKSYAGEEKSVEELSEYTTDGSVDIRGQPASRKRTGGWVAGFLVLVNQGFATLAFFGVSVNLVLFLTRVLQQNNAEAANNVSKWTGTVYIFSLFGAFLSDSYWGRYKTCAVFQIIFVLGLAVLSLSTKLFLLEPKGCGGDDIPCRTHSSLEVGVFYLSIYLIALGNGGYQPNIATFGADQFEEGDPKEGRSKVSFFSYFYLALNLGSLFSNTLLSYFEDQGLWAFGFWASASSATAGLVLFLVGTPWYRHFRPGGNPIAKVAQVIVAASRKWRETLQPGEDDLYEIDGKELAAAGGCRKILHTDGFKFLDRAALVDSENFSVEDQQIPRDPWRLCTITQVEEVKCVIRLLPIWLCTIIYSVVFTQMASLFVVQGAAMNKSVAGGFHIPPASMSAFDILSVASVIFLYRHLLHPLVCRLKKDITGLTELQRMGVGIVIAIMAMVSAGLVEHYRLKCAVGDGSSLSILWQVPQYSLIGASEVFMYVGQLEFFNGQAPDGLKSFGSALCMTSMSLGNYVSDLIVSAVMSMTTNNDRPGWIPADLNTGEMDRFFFLLAAMASANLGMYVVCARQYKSIQMEGKCNDDAVDANV